MSLFRNIKILLRSGSWDFMRSQQRGPENYAKPLYVYNWHGRQIHYRPGTSDHGLIYEILIRKPDKAEYHVDARVHPDIIVDIGANIGITALWLNRKFPNAKIYCFEPMQDNFEILQKNISGIENIQAFNFGLGNTNDELDIFSNVDETNRGGFSIYQREDDPDNLGTRTASVGKIQIRKAGEALAELGIKKIDLLKIDTEGAEYDILTSIPDSFLEDCQWVMGELHGIKNFESLALLNKWVAIEMRKPITSELFIFFGLNKRLL
ncbi:MAG: FkbM family methyltransferase [Gammaproteobacteria bacterium]|nr:FkbM family methyltransferase [Gammaproteobacteria bacterium]